MQIVFLYSSGVGDLISISAIARTLQASGHECYVFTCADEATVDTAQHLDGFTDCFVEEKGPQWREKAELLFPDALFPKISLGDYKRSHMSRIRVLLEKTGYAFDRILQPCWRVTTTERDEACTWLRKQFGVLPERLVYLGNHARVVMRALDPTTFAQLYQALIRAGYNVVVNQTDAVILRRLSDTSQVVAADGLSFALRAAVIQESDLCISVDTGILHMAVALGKRVIGIFGMFPFQHVCDEYHGCYEAPMTKRLGCYGCRAIQASGYTERCTLRGCAQVAAMDVAATVRLVENLLSVRIHKGSQAALRLVARTPEAAVRLQG